MWLHAISRYYRLGETPHQMLRRRWWDLLSAGKAMAGQIELQKQLQQENGWPTRE